MLEVYVPIWVTARTELIDRLLLDRKRQDFITHMDKIVRVGEFAQLDCDPEYAGLKKMRSKSNHRQASAGVR